MAIFVSSAGQFTVRETGLGGFHLATLFGRLDVNVLYIYLFGCNILKQR